MCMEIATSSAPFFQCQKWRKKKLQLLKPLTVSVVISSFTKHEITFLVDDLVVHTSFIFIYLVVADDFHLLAILMKSCYINRSC